MNKGLYFYFSTFSNVRLERLNNLPFDAVKPNFVAIYVFFFFFSSHLVYRNNFLLSNRGETEAILFLFGSSEVNSNNNNNNLFAYIAHFP